MTRQYKESDVANAEVSEKRKKVVDILRADPHSNKKALVEEFGLSRRTVQRLNNALRNKNDEELSKLREVENNRPGPSLVLSRDEEDMICQRMQYCAARGFPVYEDEVPRILVHIAVDGRVGYKNGLPTKQTLRWFRARHADNITL